MARSKLAQKGELADAIDALAHGNHGDPFSILGPHADGDGIVLRTFQPQAERVWILGADDGRRLVFTYGRHASRTGVNALLSDLGKAGIRFRDLETRQSSLQDIFVGLLRGRR